MKLQCDVEVVNRMLPSFGMKSRGKGVRAVVSIGKHSDKSSHRSNIYMMICTAKDRSGSKYKVSELLALDSSVRVHRVLTVMFFQPAWVLNGSVSYYYCFF